MAVWAILAVLLAVGATLMAPAAPAQALERRTGGDVVVVAEGEIVDDDLVATGRLVRIDGTVRGDVYAFGQNVTVTSSGVVEGDVIAAAAQVVIEGQVRGNVRAAGAGVQVNGPVGRNVSAAAQLLQLGSGGRVGGNWLGTGETLSIAGDVDGGLAGSGRDVILQGRIGRDAEVAVTHLTVAPSARIGGDLTYRAERELDVPAQAVAGRVVFQAAEAAGPARTHRPPGTGALGAVMNVLSLTWLLASAVVGLVTLRLFPRFAATFLAVLEGQPLLSLGVGLLVLIATLPVAVLTGLTVIGLPVAGLLVAGYFTGLWFGWLLLAAATGAILIGLARRGRPVHYAWSFLFGLLVLYVAGRIPVVGGLVTLLGLSLGLGTLVVALYRAWRGSQNLPGPAAPAATGAPPAPAGPARVVPMSP